MSENQKVAQLLHSVKDSERKLSELEQSYRLTKGQITAEITSHVSQLAMLADSQAKRAKIIHELYWNQKLSTDIISEAFGIKAGRIRTIAGSLTLNVPCTRECGNVTKKIYTSRAQMDFDTRWERREAKHAQRYPDRPPTSFHNVCEECLNKDRSESEAKAAQRRQAIRLRVEQLRHMAWEEFIETEEWVEMRNRLLHTIGYKCEICGAKNVSLHIYPHKDSPNDNLCLADKEYACFVLCTDCLPRCSDLIIKGNGETIKREFMENIFAWNQEHYREIRF